MELLIIFNLMADKNVGFGIYTNYAAINVFLLGWIAQYTYWTFNIDKEVKINSCVGFKFIYIQLKPSLYY